MATVNDAGRSFLTHTVVDGHHAIRVAIGALGTEQRHVARLWDDLRLAAGETPSTVVGDPS